MAQLSRVFSAGRRSTPPAVSADQPPAASGPAIESLDVSSDDEEDSRHGWVIVGCVFAINTVTWGMNTTYGVYISYYIAHDYFEGATYLRYAFVGGLSVAFAWFAAPFVNYLTKTFGIRVPMAAGVVAGLVLFVHHLKNTRRKLTRTPTDSSPISTGFTTLVREAPKPSPVMGYFIALYSNASYATDGLGLSQRQGAALQSILAAGQVLGRPLVGQALDMAGRLNMAIAANILAALSCLVIWLPARSFAVLALFSIMQGGFGGTILCVIAPVATSAVGVIDVGSALAMFWLMMVLPATFAQPAAVALIDYSRHTLKREGPDVYQASIILCGGLFALSAAMLCGGKVAIQGNFKIFKKT
ncbi:hypothetical protein ACHAPT_012758 [Fusarium lateritium]